MNSNGRPASVGAEQNVLSHFSASLRAATPARTHDGHRISANLFAIPLGFAGLAQCWTLAADLGVTSAWPGDVLWAITAAVWLLVASAYFGRHHRPADLGRELADPTFGPFVAVSAIVPMVLGGALGRHLHTAGQVVFLVALVFTLLAGGWLSGQWIVSDATLAQWHPGYFLPTVGGGLIGAAVAVGFGYRSLAFVLFGYGAVCWIVLGSIILARLFTQPALPVPLRTTIAIELAPPVVAGTAWFRINGGHVDSVALGLAGYVLLMAMVQTRLVPYFLGVPFGPGWWAFSFPYAATVAYAIRWLRVEHVGGSRVWTWALLVVATAAATWLTGQTVVALNADRFLPHVPPPATSNVVSGNPSGTPSARPLRGSENGRLAWERRRRRRIR